MNAVIKVWLGPSGQAVRDIIKLIETEGWYLVQTRGSHRQTEGLDTMNKGKDLRKLEILDLDLLRVKMTLYTFLAISEKEEQKGAVAGC